VEPDGPQHDRPATFVIAQQYFSAIIITLRSHYRKRKIRPENVIISYVRLLCLQLSKLGIA
jgi:hypothetical protein